ncbi:pantothenate kinase, type III [Aedoeadaptatus coxii]|uniref:Type III pantothenate kinase n=1 Tax=Aedoeadaptatus coxii TaxID=755172 RepID=A0A134AL02_9FIRM|nr:type III pantothenate kinase [Peptoniphilus coxii]KXB68392.1 pantothenate kinase, type III [Peptoniphilus coxii]CAC9926481.1 pantothenate kinase, type III [Peptoniphilus coxii]
MLLAIDVGNTNIVFGAFKGRELIHDWRIASDQKKTSDEFGMLVTEMLNNVQLKPVDIEAVIMSSVVPNIMHTMQNMIVKYFHQYPMIVGAGVKTGINIRYDNPREVGADRIVNAIAAVERYGGPCIIIDLGTAITFCVVDDKKNYLGGLILPGISISADALVSRTSKLPKIEIIKPEKVIGKTTVSSMQNGLYYGFSSMIDGIVKHICDEIQMDPSDVHVIATGGFSNLLVSDSAYDIIIDRDLTMDGLRILYDMNN